jgi:chromosome segregation ATPase
VAHLTSSISVKDEQLRNRGAVALQSEQGWSNQLNILTAQLNHESGLREKAEAALSAQELQSSMALDFDDLRRRCKFYQDNSERLSKQIKTVTAENESLRALEKAKTHEIHVLEGLLKSQGHQW